jgi:16S rRNA G1207 methylase RsmC
LKLENWQISLCKLIIKELKPMPHEILLDVGCGNGWLASITNSANISYIRLDIDKPNTIADKTWEKLWV